MAVAWSSRKATNCIVRSRPINSLIAMTQVYNMAAPTGQRGLALSFQNNPLDIDNSRCLSHGHLKKPLI